MKTTELVDGVHSSVLGFGCAPILGAVDSVKSQRAIEFAIDNGITHFDLARSYGYGEAEKFVGKVIKNRRDKVVIASKFGIKPSWAASVLKPAKPFLRFIKGKPATKPLRPADESSKLSDYFLKRVPLTGAEMRKSLERSLKELRTDYIDYFFIHEPRNFLINVDELSEMAEILKKEGKIRGWGLAYMRSKEHVHKPYLNKFGLLQFDNSPGAPGYEAVVSERGPKPNIIFSPLRGGSSELSASEKLQRLFNDFPKSVVLCSMFNEKHLLENIKLLSK